MGTEKRKFDVKRVDMSQITIERTSESSGEVLTLETSGSNLYAPVILPLSARLANQIFVKPCSSARLLLPWAEMTRGPVSACLLLTITVMAEIASWFRSCQQSAS